MRKNGNTGKESLNKIFILIRGVVISGNIVTVFWKEGETAGLYCVLKKESLSWEYYSYTRNNNTVVIRFLYSNTKIRNSYLKKKKELVLLTEKILI